MDQRCPSKVFAALLLAVGLPCTAAGAGDQARSIINSIDPHKLNELIEVSKTQPDAALTNLAPISANKFRFLFVWPASNPLMTYDRVGRSFAERLVLFAEQMQLLAVGFCLPARSMYYGVTEYGDEEVNVAYRDIEVHYQFGWQAPCGGKYITFADLEGSLNAIKAQPQHGGVNGAGPGGAAPEPSSPQEQLKPFLNPAPAGPLE